MTNNGPSAAYNASLVEAVPNNAMFVSMATPAGWNCIHDRRWQHRQRGLHGSEPGNQAFLASAATLAVRRETLREAVFL